MWDWHKTHCEHCGLTPTELTNYTLSGLVERAQSLTALAGLLERLSPDDARAVAADAVRCTRQARCLLTVDDRLRNGSLAQHGS
jgi:hypothetical protein